MNGNFNRSRSAHMLTHSRTRTRTPITERLIGLNNDHAIYCVAFLRPSSNYSYDKYLVRDVIRDGECARVFAGYMTFIYLLLLVSGLLAVLLSGNALITINLVTLRRDWLISDGA